MNARPLARLTLAVSAVVVLGCSQDRAPSPLLPTEASPSASLAAAATCSWPTVQSAANAYFTSSTDPVYPTLATMKAKHDAGDTGAATTLGFDVLGRLGTAADAKSAAVVKGTPTQGSAFAKGVLSCMQAPAGYTGTIDFAPALGGSGLFAVRGGAKQSPVSSRGTDARGLPLFGAEKTGATWHAATPWILFYGFEITPSIFSDETAAGATFELSTLPSGLTFAPPIRAGVCTYDGNFVRILHGASTGDVLLSDAGLPGFCATSTSTSSSGFGSAVRSLASWFLPADLHAANSMALRAGGGGLLSGLSPIGAFTFTPELEFATQPSRSSISRKPPAEQFTPLIRVRAKTTLDTPLEGVTITLMVSNNNGSYTAPAANTAVTDHEGIATFPLFYLDKPGGYLIRATAAEFRITTTSERFNINGR